MKLYENIQDYKLFGISLLSIKYDGLYDIYFLFDKFKVFKTENDRDFWNDWER